MAAADHSVLKTIFDHFQEWTKAEIKQRVPQKLPFSSLYFTLYSSSLLFLLILYTGFLEDKPPISCQTNHDFDLDETSFFNKICFFNGTFVLQNAFTSEQVKENLGYYRHVLPIIVFLFFFCGFSIFINHLVLEYQRTKLLGFPPSRKTSTAKRIKCACCQIKKAKGDRFWRTTQLVFMYLLSDISPLIWSVASFHLTDLYLEGQFKSYGLNMLLYILFRVPNDHLRSLFPLRSTCEQYEYGSSGTQFRMSGDCLLTFQQLFSPGPLLPTSGSSMSPLSLPSLSAFWQS
ncbi:hypothetical protein TYRP_012995 [Tyrophagus putrescentiae]|nr:hypothetical protein TYRP_012995 [Tyrophagus putrescentiae]